MGNVNYSFQSTGDCIDGCGRKKATTAHITFEAEEVDGKPKNPALTIAGACTVCGKKNNWVLAGREALSALNDVMKKRQK